MIYCYQKHLLKRYCSRIALCGFRINAIQFLTSRILDDVISGIRISLRVKYTIHTDYYNIKSYIRGENYMSFGKDLTKKFRKLTRNGEFQEVELITKLQEAFINLANGKYHYAIDIIHGS